MDAWTILAIIVWVVAIVGAWWIIHVTCYWTRVGSRWARRNPPKGRFW